MYRLHLTRERVAGHWSSGEIVALIAAVEDDVLRHGACDPVRVVTDARHGFSGAECQTVWRSAVQIRAKIRELPALKRVRIGSAKQ